MVDIHVVRSERRTDVIMAGTLDNLLFVRGFNSSNLLFSFREPLG